MTLAHRLTVDFWGYGLSSTMTATAVTVAYDADRACT
jgi:hypothetical protein